jgi:hypothetical protein
MRTRHAWPWLILNDRRTRVVVLRRETAYGISTSWFLQFEAFDDGHVDTIPVLSQQILTSSTGSLQSWPVPGDWNGAANKIECIGAGASPGGGAAYANSINVALTPSGTASYEIAAPGVGDTWFNAATLGASVCGAKGASGTTGGQSSGCVFNNFANSGGNAASNGGGGAGGPSGAGGNASGNTGGAADGGAVAGATAGNPGNSGTEFDATHGCGSGGGGDAGSGAGGNGGLYGGGGGGAAENPGGGAQGIIVITYAPVTTPFDPWPSLGPITSFMTPRF